MNILQVIAAVLVLFFLPGYTFINMLFPKRGELDLEYDQLYRIGLGMGMSIVISILIGYVLGYYGLFYSLYLWLTLISVTIIFFIIGFFRGGYPTLRRYMGYVGHEHGDKYDTLYNLQNLLRERKKLIKKVEEANRLSKISPRHEFYERERDKLLKEIEELDRKIDSLKEVLDEK